MTFPPLVSQSSLDALTHPLPLQLFLPLQELVAVAHSDVPLQELVPEHLTSATFVAGSVAGFSAAAVLSVAALSPPPQAANNNADVADASAIPDNFLTDPICIPLLVFYLSPAIIFM